MMKFILLLIFPVVFSGVNCAKVGDIDAPSCIKSKIRKISLQKKWNPSATVYEYMYNGKKVYLFSSDCCDQFNSLYDSNCNLLCAPSGGITGNGDGKCADFRTAATMIRLVWKDTR